MPLSSNIQVQLYYSAYRDNLILPDALPHWVYRALTNSNSEPVPETYEQTLANTRYLINNRRAIYGLPPLEQEEQETPVFKDTKDINMAEYFEVKDDGIDFANYLDPKAEYRIHIPFRKGVVKKKPEDLRKVLEDATLLFFKAFPLSKLKEFKDQSGNVREKGTKGKTVEFTLTKTFTDKLVNFISGRTTVNDNNIRDKFRYIISYVESGSPDTLCNTLYNLFEYITRQETYFSLIDSLGALKEGKADVLHVAESFFLRDALYWVIDQYRHNREDTTVEHYKLNALNTKRPDFKQYCQAKWEKFSPIYDTRDPRPTYTIAFTMESEQVSRTNLVPSIETMYPKFEKDCSNLAERLNGFYLRAGGASFDNEQLRTNFESFNLIKGQLMFFGLSEEEATRKIMDKSFTSVKDKSGKRSKETTTGVCAITKQLIPSVFIVPLQTIKGEIQQVNAYYLNSINRYVHKYVLPKGGDTWIENALDSGQNYVADVLPYNTNALWRLTPRSCITENVKVFDKDKVYAPVPYLGIELEVERNTDCPQYITQNVYDSLGRDFIIMKQDSSLGGKLPFEIVTCPATLAYHKERWHNFMNNMELKKNLLSYKNGTCGMHVHISRDSFTGLHLAKFLHFFNKPENLHFLERLAGRGNSHHAIVDKATGTVSQDIVKRSKIIKRAPSRNEHHNNVNTGNKSTIEVRIFRGNLAKGHFFKNLEFVHALWLYTKDAAFGELDYKYFIMWLFKSNSSKIYGNLMQWLIASSLNVSNKNFEKGESDVESKKKEIKSLQLVINRKYNTKETDVLRKIGKDKVITKSELVANQ